MKRHFTFFFQTFTFFDGFLMTTAKAERKKFLPLHTIFAFKISAKDKNVADYSMSSTVSNGFDCSFFYTFSLIAIKKNSQLKKVRTDFRFRYSLQGNDTVVSTVVYSVFEGKQCTAYIPS